MLSNLYFCASVKAVSPVLLYSAAVDAPASGEKGKV